MEPKLTDAVMLLQVGVPKDIGWAMATLHDDGSISRVCKGCGVTSRATPDPVRGFVRAAFYHRPECVIMDSLVRTGGDAKPIN